jgi:hypothetical protein
MDETLEQNHSMMQVQPIESILLVIKSIHLFTPTYLEVEGKRLVPDPRLAERVDTRGGDGVVAVQIRGGQHRQRPPEAVTWLNVCVCGMYMDGMGWGRKPTHTSVDPISRTYQSTHAHTHTHTQIHTDTHTDRHTYIHTHVPVIQSGAVGKRPITKPSASFMAGAVDL